jgi:hypothetical protein
MAGASLDSFTPAMSLGPTTTFPSGSNPDHATSAVLGIGSGVEGVTPKRKNQSIDPRFCILMAGTSSVGNAAM